MHAVHVVLGTLSMQQQTLHFYSLHHSTGVHVRRWDAHLDGHMDIHGFDPKDFADWILMMDDDHANDDDDDNSEDEEKEEEKEDYNNDWLRSFQP